MHDFERTPKLARTVSCPEHGEVDAVKIAAAARTMDDSGAFVAPCASVRCFVAGPMGEVGLPARLLALREGSALAYAPIGPATARGKSALHDLKYLYGHIR